jgi:hypothetical protein
MERINGEVRDREKTMRGLKKVGLKIKGKNKWRYLLEKVNHKE